MRARTATHAVVALASGAALVLTALAMPAVAAAPPSVVGPDISGNDKAAAAADQLVASSANAGLLRRGSGDQLIRKSVTEGGSGLRYVAYERSYKGLAVVGGDAVVVTDGAGAVKSTAVAQSAAISVDVAAAKIGSAQAVSVAKAQLAKVETVGAARLVVLAWGTPKLTWEVEVTGKRADNGPSVLKVYVDAASGAVADKLDLVREGTGNGYYNGNVTISTSGSGSSFSMADSTRSGIRCGGQNGTTYTGTDDAWGNGTGTNLETACVDALYAVQKEWDMLASWLGRNGINGSGGGFPARVGLNDVNAFWNGSYTSFGHSQDNQRQATPIDVVAHEFGHAIFQTTPGGAGSGGENGGINESTGDIFGALTEAFANNPNDPPDFLVGEEVNLVGGGPIRNMYNPSALGDPNCWSSAIPNTEVHAAAGPLNHWFYLVSQGSAGSGGSPASPTCNGSSVTGIGIQDAGKIYYNAMLAKTSTWRYANIRVASLNAAKNLYPGSCTNFNTVLAAWNAISVPAQSGEPTCTIGGGNDFSIAVSPTSGSVLRGNSITATVSTAVTSGSAQTVALSASGLPSGASASFSPSSVTAGGSSTLTISTTTSASTGTFSVSITGTGASATHSAGYSLTVTSTPGTCSSPGQKLGNPGFESGTSPWTSSTGVIGAFSGQTAHGGTRFAWLDGYGTTHTDTLSQSVTLPAGCSSYSLTFWLHIDSAETTATVQYDKLTLRAGTTILATYSNLNKAAGYQQRTIDLAAYAGQTITLGFTGVEDASLQTSFVIDDTALNVS